MSYLNLQIICCPTGRPNTEVGLGRANLNFAVLWLSWVFLTSLKSVNFSGFKEPEKTSLQEFIFCRQTSSLLSYTIITGPSPINSNSNNDFTYYVSFLNALTNTLGFFQGLVKMTLLQQYLDLLNFQNILNVN